MNRRADIVRCASWECDTGMTAAKIAITLPPEQLARVRRAVRSGQAESVSGYIANVLAEHEQHESYKSSLKT